jgi:hypothetical protein
MLEHKQSQIQPLLQGKNQKPIDIGNGQLSASIGVHGLVSSINRPHKTQGFITFTPIVQFPNDKWYESEFVRHYRRQLVQLSEIEGQWNGFGFKINHDADEQYVSIVDDQNVLFSYICEDVKWHSLFEVMELDKQSYLVNTIKITNGCGEGVQFPFIFGGRMSLNRCSYGQLTEGGPIPIPPLENRMSVKGNHLSVKNGNLPAQADIFVYLNGEPLELSPADTVKENPVSYMSQHEMMLEPHTTSTIQIMYRLSEQVEEQDHPVVSYHSLESEYDWESSNHISAKEDIETFIIKRNVQYILSCCSVPVNDDYTCVITDHQLLPLSWNRDSYYMIQLLLEADRKFPGRYNIQNVVKGHLLWMFEKAERPEGYWGRAYLTNGYSKDNVFQLDQQCYPLLELCDYYYKFQDTETVERIKPQIKEILEMILDYRDHEKWVFKTGETPADDKVDYPYHFSSQVLVWYTLQQLEQLNAIFSFYPENLQAWADKVKSVCLDSFITTHNGKKLFAYLTDLKGNYQFYHDANDLPTVLAPIWAFCNVEDETWLNTMKFGFSEENKGGFYTGDFGGLGSVHTPHPWPLGAGQELLFNILTQNTEREEQVLSKLEKLVQWDGLFSEAVNEKSGEVTSRYWFSWPGAFISYVLLKNM